MLVEFFSSKRKSSNVSGAVFEITIKKLHKWQNSDISPKAYVKQEDNNFTFYSDSKKKHSDPFLMPHHKISYLKTRESSDKQKPPDVNKPSETSLVSTKYYVFICFSATSC